MDRKCNKMILAHVIHEAKKAIKTLMAHEKWRQEPLGRGSNCLKIEYEYKKKNDVDGLKHIIYMCA